MAWSDWLSPGVTPQQDTESNWGYGVRSAMTGAPTTALNAVVPGLGWLTAPVLDLLNKKPKGKAKAAAPATPLETLDFSTAGATTPSGGGAVGPSADPHSDPTAFFTQLVGKSVKVNSAQRDAAHNAAVGGVPNSQHLTGDAWDISVPGMTGAELAEKIRTSGVPFHQLIVEGNGVHFGAAEGANDGQYMLRHGDAHNASYSLLTPTVGRNSDPYTAAPEVAMDPATAMSYIPAPQMLKGVKLPAPPQEAAPAPLTPLEQIDKTALLAPLVAAEQVPDHRSKNPAWDRVAAMLAGAATAAQGAGSAPTLGQLILAAGGGAGRAFKDEKDKQRAEDEAHDELVRQTQVALAQAGINVDLTNLQTRHTNTERADTSAERARVTDFNNRDRAWGTLVDQIKMNMGIGEHNVSTVNQFNLARGQLGASAAEGEVGAQNRTNQTQTALNLDRQKDEASGAAFDTNVGKILNTVGVDPKPSGKADPLEDNARDAARFVAANNVEGALGSLAKEMVLTGTYATQLDKVTAAKVQLHIQQKDLAGAAAIVAAQLSADHAGAATIADNLAAIGGNRVAQIISKMRKKK